MIGGLIKLQDQFTIFVETRKTIEKNRIELEDDERLQIFFFSDVYEYADCCWIVRGASVGLKTDSASDR